MLVGEADTMLSSTIILYNSLLLRSMLRDERVGPGFEGCVRWTERRLRGLAGLGATTPSSRRSEAATHELSIASNIVELVAGAAAGRRVRRVTLEVGELSGVAPDAVAFCFPEVARGTDAEDANLEIREIDERPPTTPNGFEMRARRWSRSTPARVAIWTPRWCDAPSPS